MSTAPDPKFPDLPGLIFGCAPSKHRRSPVKMLLGRYNVKVKGNDKKEDYLLKLVELENSIGEREKEALVNWFAGENTCKALAALLGDALQPPIIPKDIVEPAAKKAKLQSDDDLIFAAVDECRICTERLAPENFPQSRITRRVQQEAASEAWLAENTKLCPNPECGMRIQTKSGCDHLTCDYCLFEFCWACCVDFSVIKKRGNGAHKPECEWHTDNKDGMPGHGRRRAAVSRQSAGGASKDMNVREELKGPEQVTGLEDLNDPEGVKKSHKSKETVESVESLEAIGLTQPGIPTESEKSFQPNKSHEAVKSLETTGAMESTRSNPLKRRLEE
ncbi:hypothetical protein EYC84_000729 [Monilinia fructicola]|uniref:IBR domain-containing protein n=1 Tax=Monilinia fructicola TaxID=38448 RepID=A0A5M9JJZ5_MONFR|nr:hypothetical protein EYC84_000729 [Monilinia fructicola]